VATAAKALSTYMGHSSIQITFDRYGHLLPGAEDQVTGLLDAFLARQLGGAGDNIGRRLSGSRAVGESWPDLVQPEEPGEDESTGGIPRNVRGRTLRV
jgi:hypothetical protein